jgi:hypothetical protein
MIGLSRKGLIERRPHYTESSYGLHKRVSPYPCVDQADVVPPPGRMLKKLASAEKVEVKAEVKVERKSDSPYLSLDLSLNLLESCVP